jgi:hypothetical protein
MSSMSFGQYLQQVVLHLHWHEYQNALLISQGAPAIVDYIMALWEKGQPPDLTAELVNERFMNSCPAGQLPDAEVESFDEESGE